MEERFTNRMVDVAPYNPDTDLYVKDVSSGRVFFLTPSISGSSHNGTLGNDPQISDDGAVVAFSSSSGALVVGSDPTGGGDVFRSELANVVVVRPTLITREEDGNANVAFADGPIMSGDGAYVTFGTNQFSTLGFSGTSVGPHGIGVGVIPDAPDNGGGNGGGGNAAFDQWASVLPEGMRGPNDNPSGDGVPNLVKYFIGSDAAVADLRFLPEMGTALNIFNIPGRTEEHLTLTVRIRRNLPVGYAWQVQYAQTPDQFSVSPAPTLQISGPVADGEYDVYTFGAFNAITASRPTGFLRLMVSYP